ncbi:quinolinate synthase NadA, partial [Xanthomonas citri pv. citri]|nr:quinolinate synthase NadA [Xanthomonas citri pv. citri]
ELVAGRVVNRITVPASVADPARTALERMLAVAPKQSAAQSAGAGS